MIHIRQQVWLLVVALVLIAGCADTTTTPAPPSQSPTPTPSPETAMEVLPVGPLAPGEGTSPVAITIPYVGVEVAVKPIGWQVVPRGKGRTTEWEVLPDAAGHHRGSVNVGEAGNVVISGHNTPGGGVFEGLATLGYEEGPLPEDVYAYLEDARGAVYVYRLEKRVLLPVLGATPEEVRSYVTYTQPTEDARLTLITCWPLGDTSYRLVVWGPLVGRMP